MKISIRNGVATIDGYVNAVERFSKVLQDKKGKFIERIMPNVFNKALQRTDNVAVLLNHDKSRIIASTKNGTAKLYEDNVGLRAIVEVSDSEIIEDAQKGLLRGWSFGFVCNKYDEQVNDAGIEERSIEDLDLYEVSIINSKKTPAYYGTSIELRNENQVLMEYRFTDEELNITKENIETSPTEAKPLTYNQKRELLQNKIRESYENAWIDDLDETFIYISNIDEECATYKLPYKLDGEVATIDTTNPIKVMRGGYVEIKNVPEQQSERIVGKINYSSYEERLKKIKGGNYER